MSRAQGLQYPLSAAVLPDGKLYLADRNLPGIWRAEGGKLQVFFQASKKFRTPLNAVRCVAADGQGRLLAGDSATRDVYRFDEAGQPVALTNGGIGIPMDIAVDGEGRLLVADLELHCIWRVPAAGGMPEKLAEVRAPRGLTMARDGTLWVLNSSDDQLVGIDAQGKLTPIVQGQPFSFAHDVVLDDSGTAYVSDGYAKAIWKVPPGGPPVKWVEGPPLTNPVGLAWRDKQLLVVDPRLPGVLQIAPDGKIEKLELGP
ncbi:MAG: NHL repeat-containing protein [Pirellulaceae bacterium]|nr:NHL repeat-containing protein [Pirellulaceae bacterium]